MRAPLYCMAAAAALMTAGLAAPASADDLNSLVRTLNAVVNPGDAQRLEDQARRNGRPEEERYWHNYGTGLEQQHRPRVGEAAPAYGGNRIGPEEARRLEEQAHRNGRWEDERYWRAYAAGLEGRGPETAPARREEVQYTGRIGPEQASRLEEQARRNGRWDEARYWASYRAGLERR
jgi:hypothetical protein